MIHRPRMLLRRFPVVLRGRGQVKERVDRLTNSTGTFPLDFEFIASPRVEDRASSRCIPGLSRTLAWTSTGA